MQNTTSRGILAGVALLATLCGVGAWWYATRASRPAANVDASTSAHVATAADSVADGASASPADDAPNVPTTTAAVGPKSGTSGGQSTATVTPPTPLPPADTPLTQIIDDLERRARAGDTAASCRLGFELLRCRHAANMEAQRILVDQLLTQSVARASGGGNNGRSGDATGQRRAPAGDAALIDAAARSDLMVEQAAVVCADIDPGRHATPMEWLMRAASGGDRLSRSMLLAYGDEINQGTTLENLEALARFRALAPTWVAEEFEIGGDAVQQAAWAMRTPMQTSLVLQSLADRPAFAHALYRLGQDSAVAGTPALTEAMRAVVRARLPPADAAVTAEAAQLVARYRAIRDARGRTDMTPLGYTLGAGPLLRFNPGVSAAACGRTSVPGSR